MNNVLSLFDGMSCGQIALNRIGIKYNKYYASEVDKHAIQVTQANFPETIQVGDICKLKGRDFTGIDLVMGGSPCFAKGTSVITNKGYKNIENIRVGDYVYTHKHRLKKVLAVGNKYAAICLLKSQGLKSTKVTKNHPYYTRTAKTVWNNKRRTYERIFSNPYWKQVKDLTKGDYLGIPINRTRKNALHLTKEECYILGRYIADGHVRNDLRKGRLNSRHHQIILSIGSHKLKYFLSKIPTVHYCCYLHSQSVHRVVFCNKRLTEIAEKYCGSGSGNKTISQMLLDLPESLLKKVLEGYLDGNGSERNGIYRATTVSEYLVMSLSLALAKVYNVNSSYEFTKRPKTTVIEGRTVNQKDTYVITFRKEMKKQSRATVINDIVWVPFNSIKESGKNDAVYNLEVKDDNSYTANNAIVHNCQGFSLAGKQLNFDDPRSKLFFEFVRILKEVNPKYFLLENVRMKKEYQDTISQHLGVEPILINSSLVSAQRRQRLYWTNIPGITQPEDKGILLKDIVHENTFTDRDKSYCIDANYSNGASFKNYKKKYRRQLVLAGLKEYIVDYNKTLQILDMETKAGKIGYFGKDSQANRIYSIHGKSVTLCGEAGGGAAKMGQYLFECITPDRINKRQHRQHFSDGKKFYTLTAQDRHGVLIEGYIRKLTPIECERLQTVEDDFTNHVSNTQRYRMLGNGWTVDVIAHILRNIKGD